MGDPRAKWVVLFNGGNWDGSGKTPVSAKFNGTIAWFNGGPKDIATPLV
jgi:hypothetical protein